MQIVQIGSYPLSADCIRGGVEASVYGLSQELANHHDVDVFDIPRIGGKNTGNRYGKLTIHRYANPGTHNQDAIDTLPIMLRDIVALGPTICHIHGTNPFSLAIYKALKHYGIPTIVTVHGLATVEKRNALRRNPSLKSIYQYIVQSKAEKELLSICPLVIVDTEYVAKVIQQFQLTHQPKMYIISQGISSHYFQLKNQPKDKKILSVGTISKRKGHLLLLKAFDELCKTNQEISLQIIGSIAEKDYYLQLQKYIINSPNNNRIQLITNASAEDLRTAYQSSYAFALHSQEESQGIVFAEAMAVGLPIVATNVGGVTYVVKHNTNGYLSDYGDIATFANNLARLLAEQKSYQQIISSNIVESKKYNWSSIAKKVEEVYQRVLVSYEK